MSSPAKPQRNRAIALDYKAGATQRALAERYGIDQARVCRIIKAHKTPRGRPRLPKILDDPHYVKLRRYYGAAYAREAFGL